MFKQRRRPGLSLCLLGVALLLCQLSFAQSGATAQLSGLVTDPSGAVVEGAIVTARASDTGLTRTTRSSGEGLYVLVNLPPGSYELTVEAPRLTRLRQKGVELTVGQTATVNLSLPLLSVNEEVTIVAAPSVIESLRIGESRVIEERRIENLPINGRQFLDFTLLTPGAGSGRSNVGNSFRPGEPNQIDISFAGLEEIASMITVDGADNTNRMFGRSRSTPSLEAVREFRVNTHSYGADLGPAASSVVNIVTRSGTNTLHGSTYYFLRNDSLDARNLLAPPGYDKLNQNQFGGTIGGPVVHDGLFLFGNYEGQRRKESPSYSSVLLGNLGAINAAKRSLGLPPEVLEGKIRTSNYDSTTLRSDYSAGPTQRLSLIYRFRDDRNTNLGASTGQTSAPSNFRNAKIRDQALVANLTSNLASTFINQGMFQYARRSFDFSSVGFEPYLQIPNTLDMGRHANAVDGTRETRFEFGDTLNYTRGAHSVKFGGNSYYLRQNFFLDVTDPALALFPNLDAFLGRLPSLPFPFSVVFQFVAGPDGARPAAPPGFTTSANLPVFDAVTRSKSDLTHYGLFAQDQWRVKRNLTLNYGLRWDVDAAPEEFFAGYYKAFQPRVGISYSSLSDRLVWRAGGGIYQGVKDANLLHFSRILGQNSELGPINPEYSEGNGGLGARTISDPSIAAPAFLHFAATGAYPRPAAGQPAFPTFLIATHRTDSRGLYTYQWSTQVDYRFADNLVFSVGYVGVRGLNLSSSSALNVAPAFLKLENGKNDYALAPGIPAPRVLNPLIAPLSLYSDSIAQSTYHAGILTITKRFNRHYSFDANYTWSKALDNSGSVAIGDLPEDPYRRDLERALSKQHVAHRLVGNLAAEGSEQSWMKGFRYSLISSVASAPFYTIYAGFDVNHDGNPLSDRVANLGRSSFRGEAYVSVDARLSRAIRIFRGIRAEIVAEAFNLFNTLNVTEANTVYGAPEFIGPEPEQFGVQVPSALASFGSIRATAPPRQLQFALKVTF